MCLFTTAAAEERIALSVVFDQQRSSGEALLEVKASAKMHVALPRLLPDGRNKTLSTSSRP
jgi:hypothetical protein